jgi:ABC-type phosphonate transport system ATPase subunit
MSAPTVTPGGFKILLDTPAQNPALGYPQYAAAFQEIIARSDPRFAIGIFGGWGSGKTTLMQAIDAGLDRNHMVSVWFTAWRYEKEEHLIVPLLDTVREALVQWAQARQAPSKALATASTIGKVIHSLVAGFSLKVGIPGAVDLSFDANKSLAEAARLTKEDREAEVPRSFYHGAFRALNKAFADFVQEDPGRRIVVFVDDLDRCLPEGALEVLEAIKLFFDLEGFVFVVGLDHKVVELAVEARYARASAALPQTEREAYRIRGADYVKKIFQVPFSLFPVSIGEIDSYLQSIYQSAQLPPEQAQDLALAVRPHLNYLVGESGVNPREIKRYINAYTLLTKVMPHLDHQVVLAIQTIQFRPDWELVWRKLLAYRDVFIDAVRRQVGGELAALETLDPELSATPAQFLNYAGPGGPAAMLSTIPGIDEYIYAGEATRSDVGVGLSDLVRDLTQLREPLRIAAEKEPTSTEAHAARGKISEVRSKMARLTTLPGAYAQAIQRTLDTLEGALDDLPAKGDDRNTWLKKTDGLVRRAIGDAFQWSRSG